MKKNLLILLGIIFVATILRFYQLATLPPSLEWDEVATGYDAYSILKTGRDQYGNFLPLTIRSLDDYKPPLYTYLTVVSIAVFGWTDFAVRFPAALLGVLAVLTTYGLIRKLFDDEKIALLSALFLAISPWHVNFSRLALETNSTIFFMTAATWTFLVGLKRGWWLPLSAVLFGLNTYLYHNARVIVPLFGLLLIGLYWRQLWQKKVATGVAAIIILCFAARLIPIVTSLEGQMRFHGTSIFSTAAPVEIDQARNDYAKRRVIDIEQGIGLYGSVFHNTYVLYGLRILKNYLTHFDPNFWLFTNDSFRHHMPEMGVLYFIDLPLMLVGLYWLFHVKNKRSVAIVLAWIMLAPIPSSVTRDVPHALRSEIFLPMFQVLVVFGVLGIVTQLRQPIRRHVFLSTVAIIYFVLLSFFLHKFLFHFSRETSQSWMYGRKEAALFTQSIKDRYERVIVSTKLDQPHIFFLYYLRYDPQKYQKEGGTASGGWAEERNAFDKYQFKQIQYHFSELKDGRTLFVGLPYEFPDDTQVLHTIKYLDGTDAIWIVEG